MGFKEASEDSSWEYRGFANGYLPLDGASGCSSASRSAIFQGTFTTSIYFA